MKINICFNISRCFCPSSLLVAKIGGILPYNLTVVRILITGHSTHEWPVVCAALCTDATSKRPCVSAVKKAELFVYDQMKMSFRR